MLNQSKINVLFIISLFAGLCLFQFFLFHHYIYREIIGFYPANHDQASYLPFTYELFEDVKHGDTGLALQKMFYTLYTGVIFPLYALIAFKLLGASRFTALLPNFLLFILLQLSIFFAIRQMSRNTAMAIIAIGLLLCLETPFLVGGIADYRMDFMGFCLYGIFTTFVLQTRCLSRPTWMISAALLAALMVLTRFITLFYVLPLMFCSVCYLTHTRKNLPGFLLSCLLFSAIVIPAIFLNRHNLYQYYMVGHITGAEAALRGLPQGSRLWTTLLYYPTSVLNNHIGMTGLKTAGYVFIFFLAGFTINSAKRKDFREFANRKEDDRSRCIVNSPDQLSKFTFRCLLLATLIPLVLLTLDTSKSVVVGDIILGPLLLLFMLFCCKLNDSQPWPAWLTTLVSFVVLLTGLNHQYLAYQMQSSPEKHADLATISKMYIDIGDYAAQKKWHEILFASDQIKDSIYCGCLNTLYYEKTGKFILAHRELLGANLLPLSEKDALASVKRSNVVILTMGNYPGEWPPFQQAFSGYRHKVIRYAETHFKVLGQYDFQKNHYKVYVTK